MKTFTHYVRVFAVGILFSTLSQPALGQSSGTVGPDGSVTISLIDLPPQVSSYIGVPASGGTTAACPAGKMVIGVAGMRMKFIQKITPICGSYNKDGSIASSSLLDPSAVGANPGFRLECARGRVATKLRVAFNDNFEIYPYLGGVEISCVPWIGGQWSGDPPIAVSTTNFESWPRKSSVSCTSQVQPVRSLRIRSTTAIKALSIVCDEP